MIAIRSGHVETARRLLAKRLRPIRGTATALRPEHRRTPEETLPFSICSYQIKPRSTSPTSSE